MKTTTEERSLASNRKARFQYFFLDKYKAGIMLMGTEVKSAKNNGISMSDAYCVFKNNELWVRHLHIAPYKQGGVYNHEMKRPRKLLLQRRELRKLQAKLKERGLTIVPTEVFVDERGLIKIEIALAKGKKAFNKKDSIREKDMKRSMDRELRDR